jgi:hypothetical protein
LVEAPPAGVSEDNKLDVGILVFDPGVPEGEIDDDTAEKLLEKGVFVNIRRIESVQMAMQLRGALQKSGRWGSVWVMPNGAVTADVNVAAKIVSSDGYFAKVEVEVADAAGRTWLEKSYELETAAAAYQRERYPGLDPYQDLFNSIANDMAEIGAKLPASEVQDIKTVGALRYAGEVLPAAYGGYVVRERAGGGGRSGYEATRLPAADDPFFQRALSVRQRERLFLETLDQYYEKLTADAEPSYDGWREQAREESLAIRELTRDARWHAGLGAAAILLSLTGGSGAGAGAPRLMRDSMFLIGSQLLDMRTERLRDRTLHQASLDELSKSFDGAIEPSVVEIEGVQHRLVGTAEEQYGELRDLLRSMLAREAGGLADAAAAFDRETSELDDRR